MCLNSFPGGFNGQPGIKKKAAVISRYPLKDFHQGSSMIRSSRQGPEANTLAKEQPIPWYGYFWPWSIGRDSSKVCVPPQNLRVALNWMSTYIESVFITLTPHSKKKVNYSQYAKESKDSLAASQKCFSMVANCFSLTLKRVRALAVWIMCFLFIK